MPPVSLATCAPCGGDFARMGRGGAQHGTQPPRPMATSGSSEQQGLADTGNNPRLSALFTGTALLAIIVCFAGVEAMHASGYSQSLVSDYDEGSYTMVAQLLLAGYHPFSQIFTSQPFWFSGSLALGMRLLNQPDVVAGHLIEMMFGVMALVGVAWITWISYGKLAAIVATIVLALSPGFLVLAHAVEAEMPATGPGLLAIGAAAHYARTRQRWLLVVSGLALATSLEMKVQAAIFLPPLVLWVAGGLFQRHVAGRGKSGDIAADLVTLTAAIIVPVLITGLLLAPREQLDQVVLFHLAAARNMPLDVPANIASFEAFLRWDPSLLALAVVGMLGGLLYHPRTTLVHLVWVGTTVAFLLLYHPQIVHQFLVVLPPAAVLAGGSVAGLHLRLGRWYMMGWGIAALAIVAYGVQTPTTWSRDRDLFFTTSPTPRTALAAFVAAHTSPGEFVITDDLFVAIDAHRLVPPLLADPGSVRISAGYLTTAQMMVATQLYHVRVVALWRGVLAGRLPDYITWLRQHGYTVIPSGIPNATVLALKS